MTERRRPIGPQWQPPDWTKQLQAISASAAEAFRPVQELSERVNRALAPVMEQLPKWLEQAEGWGERLREAIIAAYPSNWRDFSIDDFGSAIDVMVEYGLNVAWVPRDAIVLELVAAPDATSRDAVLLEREAAILEDVEASLDATERTDLVEPADALREAIATFRDGHHRASQALAAVTLGTVIHDTFGEAKFAQAKKRFEALDPEQVPIVEARAAAVLRCVARALQRTDLAGPGFNRHAAAHRLSADQYTRPNAIASLMLVAGVLREVNEWTVDEDMEHPEAA
jgi:hypothetical protein